MPLSKVGSLIQDTTGGGDTLTIALVGLTVGNHLVCQVTLPDSVTITDATLSGASNVVNQNAGSISTDASLGYSTQILAVEEIITGGDQDLVVTFSGVPSVAKTGTQEWTGGDTAALINANAVDSGNADDPSTTITTTADNCAIIGHIDQSGGGEATAGADYTAYDLDNVGWWVTGQDDLDAGTAGIKTFDWVTPSSGNYAMSVVALAPEPPAGELGIALETDTALAAAASKSGQLGQPAETDTGLPATASKNRSLGLAPEIDIALPASAAKLAQLGQAPEVDSSLPASRAKDRVLGQPAETDAALPLLSATLGQATEINSGRPLARSKVAQLAQASEVNTALPAVPSKARALGVAAEANTALPLVQGDLVVGFPPFIKTAAAVITAQLAVGPAKEADTGLPMSAGKLRALGQAFEADIALPLDQPGVTLLGQAIEVNTVLPLTKAKASDLGLPTETDTARPAVPTKSQIMGLPFEVDTAFALTRTKQRALGEAQEFDIALPIGGLPAHLIARLAAKHYGVYKTWEI